MPALRTSDASTNRLARSDTGQSAEHAVRLGLRQVPIVLGLF